MNMSLRFELSATDPSSNARAGKVFTAHGEIETPIFMPVGTLGTVKTIHQHELKSVIEAQIILGNTYHLYLRPGLQVMQEAGGLHKFIGWDYPMLTDSGGYQVYSLSQRRKIKEEGVQFMSHIDGSKHWFTPENVVDIQRVIGADIIMAFDECTPYPCDYNYAKKSLGLTHRWLDRCIAQFDKGSGIYGYEQILAPIVQGSVYRDLREQSCHYIAERGRVINAIGGLSVGEPAELLYEMTGWCCENLPKDNARYLMGVGTPENLLECIGLGIDMFDCVLPTRNARHGLVYTTEGILHIRNEKWKKDFSPLDPMLGQGPVTYTKAYLRHLIHSGEFLGMQIASLQNLSFYLWLVRQAREAILAGNYVQWKNAILPVITRKL
jgi:queuine tRNA-ribosyltransferase